MQDYIEFWNAVSSFITNNLAVLGLGHNISQLIGFLMGFAGAVAPVLATVLIIGVASISATEIDVDSLEETN